MALDSSKGRGTEQRVTALAISKEQRVIYLGGQVVSTTSLTQVTNMTIPVAAGILYHYTVEFIGFQNSGTGTHSCVVQMVGPARTGNNIERHYICNESGALSNQAETEGSFGFTDATGLGSFSTTYDSRIEVKGGCTFSASGNLQFKIAEATSGFPIGVDSCIMYIRPVQ